MVRHTSYGACAIYTSPQRMVGLQGGPHEVCISSFVKRLVILVTRLVMVTRLVILVTRLVILVTSSCSSSDKGLCVCVSTRASEVGFVHKGSQLCLRVSATSYPISITLPLSSLLSHLQG